MPKTVPTDLICGTVDRLWYSFQNTCVHGPVFNTICGTDSVPMSSQSVLQPVCNRYLWAQVGRRPVCNRNLWTQVGRYDVCRRRGVLRVNRVGGVIRCY